MKTGLIAAATGYLGRHLCAEYERRGWYVVALVRNAACAGRVWLFAPGTRRINPVHGADLAVATADTIYAGEGWRDVGGPDIFTHADLAALAFDALTKRTRMVQLPDALRRGALALLPVVTPRRVSGPARFFLAAIGMDMEGVPRGTRHLAEHFQALARDTQNQTVS